MKDFDCFSGWGRNTTSVGLRLEVESAQDMRRLIQERGNSSRYRRGCISRGLGRSYGDPAQNSGGYVFQSIQKSEQSDLIDFDLDEVNGIVTAGGWVSLNDLIAYLVPRGWFVPVTPGTRFVTVGGAVASDVHGKNHHCDGSFGSHLISVDLLLASGESISCGPEVNRDLFFATIGGMGLTGFIYRVRFKAIQIETSQMTVRTERAANLEALISILLESEVSHQYTVAWIDLLATGRQLGRGIVMAGNHARKHELGTDFKGYLTKSRLSAPHALSGLMNRHSIKLFNEFWFRKAPRNATTSVESIPKFFHPLDAVKHWNRLYGKRGFIQYQFVVPQDEVTTIREVIEDLSNERAASFLAVLKKFGPSSGGFLSFPMPGWTLALDIPAGASLGPLLSRLDRKVIQAGGRHYLAKDSHMRRSTFESGYKELAKWKSVRSEVDPNGFWQSDLGRRLGLC